MDTEHLTAELSDQDRLLLVLGYLLGPLAVVNLLITRREFVKWHTKQGMILFGTLAALWALFRILLRWSDIPFLGGLFSAIVWLTGIAAVMTLMFCIARALEGERFKLPVLGDLADRW
jgi:uncharacterized membrane protein